MSQSRSPQEIRIQNEINHKKIANVHENRATEILKKVRESKPQIDIERGLYYPLTATPFTVARNNEELERNIINFDAEEYSNRVTRFLQEKGSVDDGKASKRTVRLIQTLLRRLGE